MTALPQRSPSDPEDRDIETALASRDHRRVVTLLMQRHGDAVHRFVREMVRDDALADDIHQQVFIEAYRDLASFSGRSTIKTWLFGIARHRAFDAVKMRRRWFDRFKGDEPGDAKDHAPDAGERIDDARLREALHECLDKVSAETRTAILLRYQQGFSFEDMAEVCREKPGTLQARVSRALPALRTCIETRTGGRV